MVLGLQELRQKSITIKQWKETDQSRHPTGGACHAELLLLGVIVQCPGAEKSTCKGYP
jgi:hypothetical protein